MPKKILILGGGAGGAVAANYLRKHLSKEEAEITLIDKQDYHYLQPSFIWIMTGTREPDDIRRPLKLFEKRGINFKKEQVIEIDPSNSQVKTNRGVHDYDYLIVALSTKIINKYEKLPNVCAPWTIEGALKCREQLAKFRGGDIVVGITSMPYKCPPAPFEIAFILSYLAEQRGIREKTNVTVFHEWKEPMEPFGPSMVAGFRQFMSMYNIGFQGGFQVEKVEDGKVVSKDGRELHYDLGIIVPPHEPVEPVANSPLADKTIGGYMSVDRKTLRNPDYPNVFGVGDIISPKLNIGMAGVFAHFQAEFVATQIIDEIKGTFQGETYNMSGVCVMDMGYVGAAVYCDFSPKILGTGEYPDCAMLGGMKLFRAIKIGFEKYWLHKLFGR